MQRTPLINLELQFVLKLINNTFMHVHRAHRVLGELNKLHYWRNYEFKVRFSAHDIFEEEFLYVVLKSLTC